MIETTLIKDCINGDRQSQSVLYDTYVSKMFVVCLRYSKSREEAEEVLQEGFLKVFKYLHQFRNDGSLEGWIRKIMVNCALQKLKRRSQLTPVLNLDSYKENIIMEESVESGVSSKELLNLVMSLPPAYKAVFNLYVFDGYKHREIAEILGISEGTSKSNLSDARTYLQKQLTRKQVVAQ